jgi:hypothetical protein
VRTDTKNEQQKRLSWSAPRIYLFCKRDKNWRLKKKGEKKGGAVQYVTTGLMKEEFVPPKIKKRLIWNLRS